MQQVYWSVRSLAVSNICKQLMLRLLIKTIRWLGLRAIASSKYISAASLLTDVYRRIWVDHLQKVGGKAHFFKGWDEPPPAEKGALGKQGIGSFSHVPFPMTAKSHP